MDIHVALGANEGTAPRLILAVAVVVLVATLFGWAARQLGQPAVMGEITAGAALGPSVLGAFRGDISEALFPADVRSILGSLAQLALAFYMFTVGYEVDVAALKRRPRAVTTVGLVAFTAPLAVGIGLGVLLLGYAPPGVPAPAFALFVGVLMSVTAVPVLARILHEKGLARTAPGIVSLGAASVGDVMAWILLAAVVGVAGGSGPGPVVWTITLFAAYAGLMLTVGRPLLRFALGRGHPARRLGILVGSVLASAWLTSSMGLNVVFGALLCGLITPREPGGRPDDTLLAPMQHVSLVLLPVFFVTVGFGVRLDGMSADLWGVLAAVLAAACGSKMLFGWAGARAAGMPPREAWQVGVLMNTRGLTELVAVNIGAAAGLLDSRLCVVFVSMAVLTTAMTGPLLHVINRSGFPRTQCEYGDPVNDQLDGKSVRLSMDEAA